MILKKKTACILMASGYASRFGKNKLLTEFQGKSLFQITLDSLPLDDFCGVFTVTQYPELAQLSTLYGIPTVRNPMESPELCDTIRIGTQAARKLAPEGIMYCVCDQPLRTRTSLLRMIRLFEENPDRIVALSWNGKKGNPIIYPSGVFDELEHLSGTQSGSSVLKKHPELLLLCPADRELEMLDVDTAEDFLRLNQQSVSSSPLH